ncbi:hypothetical protein D9756_008963 [Leucocoprinus leucothites]|uniref:FAD-binding domain-containing protein n=1 Tax=Leucocoprinus leucothites TaxID=201217 RepID=A0A8H5FUX5_9AGAR|nr:hypothetical protein D9756_008963 [Leucoagaricus leucothites]
MVENGEQPLRVAIIGAGMTGLLIGQGLRKNGYNVTVYEKEAYIGERVREWTMLIHWALPTLQKTLPDDILNDMRSAYTDPFYAYDKEKEALPFYNGNTGEIAFQVPAIGMRRVSRTRFRRLCTRGLDIRWSKAFKDLQMGENGPVTIIFEDGDRAEADFVIGADGTRSKVRRWLVGEEEGKVSASEHAITNGIVSYNDAEKARFVRTHPICALGSSSSGALFIAVQNVEDPEKPETWSFHVCRIFKSKTEALEGDEAIAQMKNMSKDVCEPFRSSIEWTPSGSQCFTTQMNYWITTPWDNRGSRVTLAGDAAHAMLPARGQGMNHALEDVDKLVAQLVRVKEGMPLQEALKTYEDEIFERGPRAVLTSLEDLDNLPKFEDPGSIRHQSHGLAKV